MANGAASASARMLCLRSRIGNVLKLWAYTRNATPRAGIPHQVRTSRRQSLIGRHPRVSRAVKGSAPAVSFPTAMLRFPPRALLALVLLAILGATLYPAFGDEAEPLTWCILCGEHGASDAITNLMLFLPLGAALSLCGWRSRWAVLGAALLSAGIECTQLIIPGRDPSIGDVLFNTAGGAAGVGLLRTSGVWLRPTAIRARGLLAAATLAALACFTATGYVLLPDLPDARYFGQWTPNLGHLVWYRARVLSAALDGLPLPPHRLSDSGAVRRLLLEGADLRVRAVAGPPTGGIASLSRTCAFLERCTACAAAIRSPCSSTTPRTGGASRSTTSRPAEWATRWDVPGRFSCTRRASRPGSAACSTAVGWRGSSSRSAISRSGTDSRWPSAASSRS